MASERGVSRLAVTGRDDAGFNDRLLYAGLALLRIGFGLVFLTNGIAKLPGVGNKIPPFKGFLIGRDGARSILDSDTIGHPIGIYRTLVEDVILANWNIVGTLLTVTELFIGVCLVLGVLTPIAALMGAAFQLHLNFANIHRGDKWLWEAAIQWMPLLTLALVRSGRYWGLDARLARRFPRWPVT
ncbi:MAG: DoxX family protein [Chloroflexi bacterium]|nr:DoxX family protein [Chloroflexota bacterium]